MREIVDSTVDVVSLIMQSGVHLVHDGRIYSGLCPLHSDKNTMSLKVYSDSNSWCCFGAGCGGKVGKYNGGDAIEWVKQFQKLDYHKAINWINHNYKHIPRVELPKIPYVEPKPVGYDSVIYWHKLMDACERRHWFHSRGFTDETIDREMFGWDAQRYVIPVWEGEPGKSVCLGVRLRKSELVSDTSPKYVGLSGHNPPTVWGRWYCKEHNLVIGFAGELDAARAVQDGLPAFSVVNGVNAVSKFPDDWSNKWFPDTKYLVVAFDKKEEAAGAMLARSWNKVKGTMTARVFHWPPSVDAKDYCEYRDLGNTSESFKELVAIQINAHTRL